MLLFNEDKKLTGKKEEFEEYPSRTWSCVILHDEFFRSSTPIYHDRPISQTRTLRHREHESFMPYSKQQRQDLNSVHLTLCSSFSEKSYWLFQFRNGPMSSSWSSATAAPTLHLLITECESTGLSPPQWLLSGLPPVHNPEWSWSRLPSKLYIFLCICTCCAPTWPHVELQLTRPSLFHCTRKPSIKTEVSQPIFCGSNEACHVGYFPSF